MQANSIFMGLVKQFHSFAEVCKQFSLSIFIVNNPQDYYILLCFILHNTVVFVGKCLK